MDKLQTRLDDAHLARQNMLYRWLWGHYAELRPTLSAPGAPWTDVMHVARRDGVPVTHRTNVLATWRRVVRDMDARGQQQMAAVGGDENTPGTVSLGRTIPEPFGVQARPAEVTIKPLRRS